MKLFWVIFNWIVFLAVIFGIVYLVKYWPKMKLPERGTMTGGLAVLFGLSLAWVWVNVVRFGKRKPFTCVKCLTGWFTLLLAYLYHVEFWYLYLFLGLFVGAMYEEIKMRWL